MKKVYTLISIVLVSMTSHAQYELNSIMDPIGWPVYYPGTGAIDTLETTISQDADSQNPGEWINVTKFVSPKNAQGNLTELGNYLWADSINDWVAEFAMTYTYTYNGSNQVTEMVREQSSFGISIKRFANYTIDGNGNYTVGNYVDSFDLGGTIAFVLAKDEMTYNGNGQMTERIYSESGFMQTTLEFDTRYTFSYTGGNITEILEESWSGSAWENSQKQMLSYDGNGRLTEMITQEWDGVSWLNEEKETFSYDAQGRLESQADYVDTLGSWENDNRSTYVYAVPNGNGMKIDYYDAEIGNGTSWANDHRYEFYYDGAEPQYALGYPWNGSAYDNTADERILFQDSVTTQPGSAPIAPSNLMVVPIGPLRSAFMMDLSWDDNSDNEDGFIIERSLDSAAFNTIDTVGVDVTNYMDTSGLEQATRYYYRVKAYNSFGDNGSSIVGASTWSVGVSEFSADQIQVYPNPANEVVNISGISNATIDLFDISGKLMRSVQVMNGSSQLDLKGLNSGIYLMRISNDQGSVTKRLMVN